MVCRSYKKTGHIKKVCFSIQRSKEQSEMNKTYGSHVTKEEVLSEDGEEDATN